MPTRGRVKAAGISAEGECDSVALTGVEVCIRSSAQDRTFIIFVESDNGHLNFNTQRQHSLDSTSRWGSEEALQGEISARKAKAEASHAAREQVTKDEARRPADAPPGSPTPNATYKVQHQVSRKPLRAPSRLRMLGLETETNCVGANQQTTLVLGGEKYGFFTVVNDAYFDRGPTVRA